MLNNTNWNKSNPVSDILLKAADLIEQNGHAHFIRIDHNGSMCFLGAINVAEGFPEGISPERPYAISDIELQASKAVANVLGVGIILSSDIVQDVVNWNNTHTAEEVIEVMRMAAYQKQFA